MTPLSVFEWQLEGGSYPWDQPTEVYLNGIKLNSKTRKYNPLITCPSSESHSNNKYFIEFKNPASEQLLRPVTQDEEIVIIC